MQWGWAIFSTNYQGGAVQLILLIIYLTGMLVMCHADDIRHGKKDANAYRVQPTAVQAATGPTGGQIEAGGNRPIVPMID